MLKHHRTRQLKISPGQPRCTPCVERMQWAPHTVLVQQRGYPPMAATGWKTNKQRHPRVMFGRFLSTSTFHLPWFFGGRVGEREMAVPKRHWTKDEICVWCDLLIGPASEEAPRDFPKTIVFTLYKFQLSTPQKTPPFFTFLKSSA